MPMSFQRKYSKSQTVDMIWLLSDPTSPSPISFSFICWIPIIFHSNICSKFTFSASIPKNSLSDIGYLFFASDDHTSDFTLFHLVSYIYQYLKLDAFMSVLFPIKMYSGQILPYSYLYYLCLKMRLGYNSSKFQYICAIIIKRKI